MNGSARGIYALLKTDQHWPWKMHGEPADCSRKGFTEVFGHKRKADVNENEEVNASTAFLPSDGHAVLSLTEKEWEEALEFDQDVSWPVSDQTE